MTADLVGRQIGDLQILRRLGRGGMAEVFAARQLSLGREVAIKVLLDDFCRDQSYVQRFRREALAAAKLNHANIVMILDVGELPPEPDRSHGRPFIVQELIDGENLRETLQRTGPMDAATIRNVIIAVASALHESSAAGITHRDIKPENILRSSAGSIKIADFGLARLKVSEQSAAMELTQAGLTLGTPRYMSPEQIQGKSVDVRSDLYSLGITAYHLATGRTPFDADDAVALAVKHLHDAPESVAMVRQREGGGEPIDPTLVNVIERLMAKNPEDRFQSPAEVVAVLSGGDASAALPTQGPVAKWTRRVEALSLMQRQIRRSRRRWMVAAVATAALVGVASFFAFQRWYAVDAMARLRPSSVPMEPSVEEQFLLALSRDDVPGWMAIEQYFGDGNVDGNGGDDGDGEASGDGDAATRIVESRLQLARVVGQDGQKETQAKLLQNIARDPDASRLHRVIALIRLEAITDQSESRNEIRQRLSAQYNELREISPGDAAIAWDGMPASLRMKMDLAPPR